MITTRKNPAPVAVHEIRQANSARIVRFGRFTLELDSRNPAQVLWGELGIGLGLAGMREAKGGAGGKAEFEDDEEDGAEAHEDEEDRTDGEHDKSLDEEKKVEVWVLRRNNLRQRWAGTAIRAVVAGMVLQRRHFLVFAITNIRGRKRRR